MVGFELRASKIRSDRSANCATTTAQLLADFLCPKISFHSLTHFVLLIWHFFGRAKIVSISSKTKICKNAKKVSGFRKTKNFDFGNSKSNFLSGEVSLSLSLWQLHLILLVPWRGFQVQKFTFKFLSVTVKQVKINLIDRSVIMGNIMWILDPD